MTGELESWLNGRWVRTSEAAVPLLDRGFVFGDGATDSLRTFGGRPFAVEEHVDRLFRSLRLLRIEAGVPASELVRLTYEACERNRSRLDGDADMWVVYFVSRGALELPSRPATFAIACSPIDFTEHAFAYTAGVDLATGVARQVPASAQSPRMKTLSRLHLTLAQLDAMRTSPRAIALLVDGDAEIVETTDGNVFVVDDGVLVTPSADAAVSGVTRGRTIELARAAGIPVVERSVRLYDLANADEVFLTSTGYVVLPARSVDGIPVGSRVPGLVTESLLRAWSTLVGLDIEAQAQRA